MCSSDLEVCKLVITHWLHDNGVRNGVFQLPDGREFAMFSTAYGDGVCSDNYDNQYPVDSGSIGCILASELDYPDGASGGNIVDFPTDFEPYVGGEGALVFGPVVIDTVGDDSEEWESDEWNDFEYFGETG